MGRSRGCSVTINRSGESLETGYSVVPSPAKKTPADILAKYEEKLINLEALFAGGNPFEEGGVLRTTAMPRSRQASQRSSSRSNSDCLTCKVGRSS